MDKYFGNFSCREDVAKEYAMTKGSSWDRPIEPSDDFPTDEQIHYASYDIDGYEGYSTVVFERDGKLFEVNGSHCSCYGLEECWAPEETTWDAIAMRNPGYMVTKELVDLAQSKVKPV